MKNRKRIGETKDGAPIYANTEAPLREVRFYDGRNDHTPQKLQLNDGLLQALKLRLADIMESGYGEIVIKIHNHAIAEIGITQKTRELAKI